MLAVVLDTNILVSALWTPTGNAAKIVDLMVTGQLVPFYDQRVIAEYEAVLARPKFPFALDDVRELLATITTYGYSLIVTPSDIPFPDETDRKFYDIAKAAGATLITGNIRHYPTDQIVTTPANFLFSGSDE
jgi:putative PIN family toxin of toxin-antitoxin system